MFKNKKILIAILIFTALFFVLFLSLQKEARKTSSLPNITDKILGVVYLEINQTKYESGVSGNVSVYDFMKKLQSEGKINFTEKNYPGIGEFITSINEIKGDGEKNWIYYVNDKKAEIGVSDYKIKSGDVVSWKYEKTDF